MRRIEYLSPTSIAKYRESFDEFYMQYLSDVRAPRMAQTKPMSIGSAFDAQVKSYLHAQLFGKGADPKFELRAIFEAQVEEQNRDWAWEHGAHAFACYRQSGALSDLLLELQAAAGTPRFELEVKGVVNGHREGVTRRMDSGVMFLGKPDVFYVNRDGCHVILDWKVNGWCGRGNTSPMAGYLKVRAGSGQPCLTGPHKDCIPMAHRGAMINCGQYLEQFDETWANQLSIYGWLCGADVGEDFIVAVDQLACKNVVGNKYPDVRIAEHRLRIHRDYQWRLYATAQEIWEAVRSDHVLRSMSKEDSIARCQALDQQARMLCDPNEAIFNKLMRG